MLSVAHVWTAVYEYLTGSKGLSEQPGMITFSTTVVRYLRVILRNIVCLHTKVSILFTGQL